MQGGNKKEKVLIVRGDGGKIINARRGELYLSGVKTKIAVPLRGYENGERPDTRCVYVVLHNQCGTIAAQLCVPVAEKRLGLWSSY